MQGELSKAEAERAQNGARSTGRRWLAPREASRPAGYADACMRARLTTRDGGASAGDGSDGTPPASLRPVPGSPWLVGEAHARRSLREYSAYYAHTCGAEGRVAATRV
jgi:hypothetical protein